MIFDSAGQPLPTLHCKPPGTTQSLFQKNCSMGMLTMRSLLIEQDLDTMHEWVSSPHAKKFWQMNMAKPQLGKIYTVILASEHGHSFMFLLDATPVAQVDVYQLLADELRDHVAADAWDTGLHILLLPPQQSKKGLAVEVLRCFMEWYFSFSLSDKLYAEPDSANTVAGMLAMKSGFAFQKQIQLSYKMAHLYLITRKEFYGTNQII